MASIFLNANVAALPAGDYTMWGTACTIDYDTDSMAVIGTATSAPATITVPVTGRYLIVVSLCTSNTTTNTTYARIILNGTNTNSIASRSVNQSAISANGFASGEGVRALAATNAYGLTAGDRISMNYYFPSTADLRTTSGFGDIRATYFSVQYISTIT